MSTMTRKDEILNAAEKLFFSQGYENTSVQMIIDAVGIAKGTFYHHYKSKEELLAGYVEHRTKPIYALMNELAEGHPEWDAVTKLNQIFHQTGGWKSENMDVMMVFIRALYRKENRLLLHQIQESTIETVAPILNGVISQGVEEKLFHTDYPEEMGALIMRLGTGMNSTLTEELLCPTENLEKKLTRVIRMYEEGIERLLQAPEGSISLADKEVIHDMCRQLRNNLGGTHD